MFELARHKICPHYPTPFWGSIARVERLKDDLPLGKIWVLRSGGCLQLSRSGKSEGSERFALKSPGSASSSKQPEDHEEVGHNPTSREFALVPMLFLP